MNGSHERGRRTRRGGFTLLEAVVVLAILVAVTSIAVPLLGSAQDDTLVGIARAEAAAIRDACIRFKLDNGRYPIELADLVASTPPSGYTPTLASWDPDTRRGWRGPYLTSGKTTLVNGSPLLVGGVPKLGDPWERLEPATPDSERRVWSLVGNEIRSNGPNSNVLVNGVLTPTPDDDVRVTLP